MPANTVYVGRPSIYGNPVSFEVVGRQEAKDAYRHYLTAFPTVADHVREKLRGKNLACWCRLDQPCHADVLLEVANAPRRVTDEAR